MSNNQPTLLDQDLQLAELKELVATAILPHDSAEQHDPTDSAQLTGQPINMVIASLTAQLRRENENIARLMEQQRRLRLQLLQAQEQSLAALRKSSEQKI